MIQPLIKAQTFNVAQAFGEAQRLHQQGRLQEAEILCLQVLQARPDHVDALHMMAMICHGRGQQVEALRLISAAMQARKPTPAILFNRGIILSALARQQDALASFDEAIRLKSKFAEAHYNRGMVLSALAREDEAAEAFKKAGAIKPDFTDAHFYRGRALLNLGRAEEALKATERALMLNPKHAQAHNNRGVALTRLGRYQEALLSHERALALDSHLAEARNNCARVLARLNRYEEALACLDAALAQHPEDADAHSDRSTVLYRLGRFEDALKAIDRALALNPDHAVAHNTRGVLLTTLLRYDEALASHDRALAVDPGMAVACNNRSRILYLMNRFDEALDYLDGAQARRPDDPDVYYIRGRVLLKLNRNDEAAANFQRALALQPDHADARFGDCFAEVPIVYGDVDEIDRRRAAYERKLTALRADVEAKKLSAVAQAITTKQPFYLAYQGRNDRGLQAIYGGMIADVIARQYPPTLLSPLPAPGEPIRVGIVSGFFFGHSNWKMPISGWLSQLDRTRFQVFGYHLSPVRDATTNVAEDLCQRFVQLPLDVAGWRREILADAPHVLIYPGIQMDTISFQLAAQRLAPVQCNSWGHPQTSGLPTMDYFLSSDLMEPPDGADHYTEQLVRLPNLSVYYEPVDSMPVPLTRQALGLREDATVFWSGQSLYKYLPQYDDVFARIAREAPDSQFVFIRHNGSENVTAIFEARLARAFAVHGLDAARHCVFLDPMGQNEFIAAVGLCDIFLDSVSWSGCNSAMEGLQHNLPIVTVPGPLMRGRHSMAILQMMGVTDTIAATLDDYVATAARLAGAPEERRALSRRIAAQKQRLYRDRACITALEDFLERAVCEHAR